jgi:hypothetical protein
MLVEPVDDGVEHLLCLGRRLPEWYEWKASGIARVSGLNAG